MKSKTLLGMSSALCLGALSLAAQETTELEQLKRQLQEIQRKFEQTAREQRQQIEALEQQIKGLKNPQAPAPNATSTTVPVPAPVPTNAEADTSRWKPSDPIRIGDQKKAYLDIGLVGSFVAGASSANDIAGGTQLGGHDPNQNGFTVQGIEANFSGAVDPYFRGNANLLFGVDADSETFTEVEEAWLETVSLPWNLKLRGGQMFTEFGRLNPTHVHSWDFVDVPLVNGRFLGADGQRNPGGFISWLTPTPFYSELFLSVQNSSGVTASSFRAPEAGEGGHHHGAESEVPFGYRHPDNDRGVNSFSDLLLTPRYVVSFDLTDTQTLVLGGSAAFGPNNVGAEGDTRTEIYGADLTWKWTSPKQTGGFPFVKWQSEVMWRNIDAGAFDWDEDADGLVSEGEIEDLDTGLPAVMAAETLNDFGFYTQLVYGFRKGWSAGVRYDWLDRDDGAYELRNLAFEGKQLGRDPLRDARWRVSPALTWYPTEFSKLRLQYNYDDRRDIGVDHSVWFQFEFILGAHAAHKF